MNHYEEQRAFEEANPDIVACNEPVFDSAAAHTGKDCAKTCLAEFAHMIKERGYYRVAAKATEFIFMLDGYEFPPKQLALDFRNFARDKGIPVTKMKDAEIIQVLYNAVPFVVDSEFIPRPGVKNYRYRCVTRSSFVRNTWEPYQESGKSVAGDAPRLDLYFELVERNIPDAEQREWFHDWVAHMLQHPDQRPQVGGYLMGAPGTGKSKIFSWFLSKLVNGRMKTLPRAPTGEFDIASLSSDLLVVLDDIKHVTTAQANALKAVVSEPTLASAAKYGDIKNRRYFFRTFILCNPQTMFPLNKDDRRWYVFNKAEHKVSEEETAHFVDVILKDELLRCGEDLDNYDAHGPFIDALYDFYMSRNITRSMYHVERTEAFYRISCATLDDVVAIMDAAEPYLALTIDHLKPFIQYDPAPKDNRIGTVLRENGFESAQLRIDGVATRLYYRVATFGDKPKGADVAPYLNLCQSYLEVAHDEPVTDQPTDQTTTSEVQTTAPEVDQVPTAPEVADTPAPVVSGLTIGEPANEPSLNADSAEECEPPADLFAAFEDTEPEEEEVKGCTFARHEELEDLRVDVSPSMEPVAGGYGVPLPDDVGVVFSMLCDHQTYKLIEEGRYLRVREVCGYWLAA